MDALSLGGEDGVLGRRQLGALQVLVDLGEAGIVLVGIGGQDAGRDDLPVQRAGRLKAVPTGDQMKAGCGRSQDDRLLESALLHGIRKRRDGVRANLAQAIRQHSDGGEVNVVRGDRAVIGGAPGHGRTPCRCTRKPLIRAARRGRALLSWYWQR